MATLVILGLITIITGACIGAFLKICFAIRGEDRRKWSLRRDAPSQAAQSARDFVGISGTKWE
jgi:hypothetical protein